VERPCASAQRASLGWLVVLTLRYRRRRARQATFLAFTLTGAAIVYANRNITGFRNALRAPQKAGISL
jgi:hypothetical protein